MNFLWVQMTYDARIFGKCNYGCEFFSLEEKAESSRIMFLLIFKNLWICESGDFMRQIHCYRISLKFKETFSI